MRENDVFEQEVIDAQAPLKRWARRFYHNESDAEDAVQDAVEQALLSQRRPTTASVRTWMGSILYFRFLDGLKRRRRLPIDPAALEDFADSIQAPDDQHAALAVKQMVARLLSPQQYATAIRAIAGLDHREISAELGIAEGTVKSRMFTVRQKLQAHMADA